MDSSNKRPHQEDSEVVSFKKPCLEDTFKNEKGMVLPSHYTQFQKEELSKFQCPRRGYTWLRETLPKFLEDNLENLGDRLLTGNSIVFHLSWNLDKQEFKMMEGQLKIPLILKIKTDGRTHVRYPTYPFTQEWLTSHRRWQALRLAVLHLEKWLTLQNLYHTRVESYTNPMHTPMKDDKEADKTITVTVQFNDYLLLV